MQAFEIPEHAIQHCAYFLWEELGRPQGRDLEIWLAAKERLRHDPRFARKGPPRTNRRRKNLELAGV
jgi:hypothetical protein